MANLISSFSDLLGTFSEHKYLDDGVDRANRIYAPVVLMISASLLGLIQFFGDPIECSKVSMDANADDSYVKAFCWASGTYAIVDAEGKLIEDDDDKILISYYQWVPVVLALQAFFFQLPFVFWDSFSTGSGLNLPSLMKGAFNLTEVQEDSETREGFCKEVAYLMDAYFKRNITRTKKKWKKNALHNLTLCYFASKVFYLINISAQLWLVNEFLGHRLFAYSTKSLLSLFEGKGWMASNMFPLLAECRFYNKIEDVGSAKKKKKHLCTLPLNLYNDKVFCVIVIMLIFLLILMTLSLLVWIFRFLFRSNREDLLVHILQKEDRDAVNRFMRAYLRTDGLLVLKLIRLNMGVNTTTEIVQRLFLLFKEMNSTLDYAESLATLESFRTGATSVGARSIGAPSIAGDTRPASPLVDRGVIGERGVVLDRGGVVERRHLRGNNGGFYHGYENTTTV